MLNVSTNHNNQKLIEMERVPIPAKATKPKLLDQLRESLRSRHYSRRTEQTYCLWVKRFIHELDLKDG